MIVVIDTNIFVSGIFWSGTPYELLKLWVANKFQVVFTPETLNECFKVLKEIGKDKDPTLAGEWILFISKNSQLVDKVSNLVLCRDKDDDKFINCAISGKAEFIISGDKDLTDLKEVNGVKIIKPKQFYDMIMK